MRAGLSTIQQTLTPEAATVLNHSIAEAGRRNHGQTTPLHVAATLLASPSGFLRQACIKSHPNSSHPLQCRALELCFSVALERLPTAQNMSSGMEPPISNALMAALKRAQAHQRRGCPEQQQQPLLAVKVELEQLIISILDDPSVSRVMREASFSSPAVKATIEQSLNTSASVGNSSPMGLGFRAGATTAPPAANRNLYLNPRLQQQGTAAQLGQQRGEEVKRVIDILLRTKKRNPVLVGESEPEAVVRELLCRLENKELGEGPLGNAQVIRLEKEFSSDRAQIPAKVKELGDLIANSSGGGVVLDLGDLKWLVEQPVGFGVAGSGAAAQQHVSEVGRAAVAEMGKLLNRFGEGTLGRLWLIGTATCETYLRCQVYHPTMENDWDLQAVPIAARAPSGVFPRLGANGILSSSVESLSPMKGFPAATTAPPRRLTENLDPGRRTSCCPQCSQNYEQELATPLPKESDNSSSEIKSEAARPALPQWLQNAKAPDSDDKATDQTKGKEEEVVGKQRSQELQKKWSETCLRLHPSFHQPNLNAERITPVPFVMTGLYNTNLIGRQSFPSKLQLNRNLGETLQSNTNQVPAQPSEKVVSSPGSPVRTDLVLGRTKTSEDSPDQTHKERVKDLLGSLSSEPQNNLHETQSNKLTHGTLDADSFKKLLKVLMEKVWWQREAASAVAATVTHCRVGNGKQRGAGSKGDMWLLFMGRDRAGKKKMASALSEMVSGSGPVIICFGSHCDDGASGMSFRGKTALDRIAEAVRRNPFSVIMLEDIDEADILVRGSIKRAMVRGRLTDSHGREVSLGSIIFILTSNWLPDNLKYSSNGVSLDGEKLAGLTKGDCQLKISLCERTAKRPANWLHDKERPTKPSRKETSSGLAFDLNEAADVEDDRGDGSHNSSDLTIEHEYEQGLNNNPRSSAISAVPHELLDAVDEAILFKPVSLGPIQSNISSAITKKFCTIVGDGVSIEVQEEALEKIAGGVWLGEVGLEEWLEKVLSPSFHQLKARLAGSIRPDCMAVRLEDDGSSDSRGLGDWLPSSVKVVVGDGL